MDIVCADKPVVHVLKLKVDTCASGKTLTVRIARHMYGYMWQAKTEYVTNIILTADNGRDIECCAVLEILCRYMDCQWRKYKLCVVDVAGPAILQLHACKRVHLREMHTADHTARSVMSSLQLMA